MTSLVERKTSQLLKCNVCAKVFTKKFSLLKHIKEFHNSISYMNTKYVEHKIICFICAMPTPRLNSLREHMKVAHGMKLYQQTIEFASLQEFTSWKANYELANKCSYVKKSSTKTLASVSKYYYYCKEPCNVMPNTSIGQQVLKKTLCTSSMELSIKKNSHMLKFWPVHFGHSFDAGKQSPKNVLAPNETMKESADDPISHSIKNYSQDSVSCHVCLSNESVVKEIKDVQSDVSDFIKFFCELTSLQIDATKYMICEKCTTKAMDAYNFRLTAVASQSYSRTVQVLDEVIPHAKEKTVRPTQPKENKSKERKNTQKDCHMCSICDKKFKYESEMQRHKLSHSGVFECSTCHKKFGFKSSLSRHMRQHGRRESVSCDECGSAFLDHNLLKRHVAYAHQGKTHKCAECQATFGSRTALTYHMKIHEEKQHSCNICGDKFTYRHQLKRHQLCHSGASRGSLDKKFGRWCRKNIKQKHNKKHETVCNRKNIQSKNKRVHSDSLKRKKFKETNDSDDKNTAQIVEEVASMMNDQIKNKSDIDNVCKPPVSISTGNDFTDTPNLHSTINKESCKTIVSIEDANTSCNNCSCECASSIIADKLTTINVDSHSTNTNRSKENVPAAVMDVEMNGIDCKGVLGKCIVENNNGEECICAKVSYEAPLPEYLTTPLLMALEKQGYYPG